MLSYTPDKLFSKEEWFSVVQIARYFSRLSALKKADLLNGVVNASLEDEYKIKYVNKAEAMEKRLQIGIDWTLDVVFVVHDSLASVLREKEQKKHVLTLKLYDKNKCEPFISR